MTALKYWDGSGWVLVAGTPGPEGPEGPVGPQGPTAYVAQPGTPGATDVIWVDTDEPDPDPLAPEAVHLIGAAGEPAFGAAWSNYSGAFLPAGFYKHQERVFLQGLIKKSSAVVLGETIFTLPAGYRPANTALLTITSSSVIGRLDVYSTGPVNINQGSAGFVALDGLSWRAA